jgi:hypothetical protein
MLRVLASPARIALPTIAPTLSLSIRFNLLFRLSDDLPHAKPQTAHDGAKPSIAATLRRWVSAELSADGARLGNNVSMHFRNSSCVMSVGVGNEPITANKANLTKQTS